MLKLNCPTLAVLLVLTLVPGVCVAKSAANKQSGTPTFTLTSSRPSPQKLGTSIVWTVATQNGLPGHIYDYRFSVSLRNNTQIVRDFTVNSSFTWVPYQVEGTYTVSVVVRDITQMPYIVFPPLPVQYVILPWVSQSGASYVNSTANPLVALFSGPPCTPGHSLRVRFQLAAGTASSTTNSVPCSQYSANFYVAGMLPSSQYLMHWEEYGPNFAGASGSNLLFTTGPLPSNFPPLQTSVLVPATGHDAAFPVVLFQLLPGVPPAISWPIATDLKGNVIWFYPGQITMTRMGIGGTFFSMTNTVLAGYDLAGNETVETNLAIVNEQLVQKGYPTLTSLNIHETRILPNGNLLILGARDEVSTSEQGGTPTNPVDILGDMILILDHNMQVLWVWDAFAHQDLGRSATLNDVCIHHQAGCPEFNLNFYSAHDWLHSNAVQLAPDGNILLSERSQDWILKINYQNGRGDGSIMWKMGPYGDFTILNPPNNSCGDPNVFPWFTHQHDSSYQLENGIVPVLGVFDDGNLRVTQCTTGNSRGAVMYVNESARTVYYAVLADLGHYSSALGSAQVLISPNSMYASFGNGAFFEGQTRIAQSIETDFTGRIVYQQQVNEWSYRTYRQQDLYTPVVP